MELFEFLRDISPWWWVSAALALGVIEMLTGTFVMLGLALAALVIAGLMALGLDLSPNLQVIIFAVLSVVFAYGGRAYLTRFGDGAPERPELNRRTQHLVGRQAKVLEAGETGGAIEVEGMRWRANWPAGAGIAVGDTVQITGGSGMELNVSST